jgi:hypothetical protein
MNAFRELPNAVQKCIVGFAATGFLIGVTLGAYAFYLTSHQRIGNMLLFIALCPPSISAMALDNAGLVGGLVAWLFIAVANGAVYGAVGFACSFVWEGTKRLLRKRSNSSHRN